MLKKINKIIASTLLFSLFFFMANCQEQFVDQEYFNFNKAIVEGVWKWPDYERPKTSFNDIGFAYEKLGKMPQPGKHPRLLFSESEISTVRQRIETTNTGTQLIENLRNRTAIFYNNTWEKKALNLLSEGKTEVAFKMLETEKPTGKKGHYQNYFISEMAFDAFDCLIFNKKKQRKKLAQAFYHYATVIDKELRHVIANNQYPLQTQRSGAREIMDYGYLAYCYDFLYNDMSKSQQDFIRELFVFHTKGRISFGMTMPPHFRNWNWVIAEHSLGLYLMAIEGEKGYDSRIYDLTVDLFQDYFDYGFSKIGTSKESVGYTGFAYYWAAPLMIAMARKGNNFITHSSYRAMKDWYLATLEPFGFRWSSYGDLGNDGPRFPEIMMRKFFYPNDSLVDYLFQNSLMEGHTNKLNESLHLIPGLVCAVDPVKENGERINYNYGQKLKQPTSFFDEERGLLISRSGWSKTAAYMQLESRIDGIAPSHDHADRGAFIFSALGRPWAIDGFRGVETKYHNSIIINGKGQGYHSTPARWIKTIDNEDATFGICDVSYSYNWSWPKTIRVTDNPEDPKFLSPRFSKYRQWVIDFKNAYPNYIEEKDTLPHVIKYWRAIGDKDYRMWDEDAWPRRIKHNTVQKAFRTAGLIKSDNPYMIVVDDIKKNNEENLYEWLMMTPFDLEVISIKNDEITLGESSVNHDNYDRNRKVTRTIKKGEPLLLVKVINRSLFKGVRQTENPSIRFETIQKIETYSIKDEVHKGRDYGACKRLVIPSRSVEPNFIVVLYPYKGGEEIPEFNYDGKELNVITKNNNDRFLFEKENNNYTKISYYKNKEKVF